MLVVAYGGVRREWGAGSGGGGKAGGGSGRRVCFILRLYLRLFAVCFKYRYLGFAVLKHK